MAVALRGLKGSWEAVTSRSPPGLWALGRAPLSVSPGPTPQSTDTGEWDASV